MTDKRKLKSYVWHGDSCFFVSTIERDSSAAIIPAPRFYETMAWSYDWEAAERGELVAHEGEGTAFEQHYEVCRQLFKTGSFSPPENCLCD